MKSLVFALSILFLVHLAWLIGWPTRGGLGAQLDRGFQFFIAVIIWMVAWMFTTVLFIAFH